MSLNAERSYKMKLRDVENAFKYRRIPYPKRSVELIALLAISCTFFLFMHTNKLNSRLKEMEVKLQPSEFSALGLTGNHISGHDAGKHDDINTLHGTYQYLKSTGQLTHLTAAQLNNTPRAQLETVFFNRVTKTGSEKMMELLKILAKRNSFEARRDVEGLYEVVIMHDAYAKNFIHTDILNSTTANTYTKHVAFIDFALLDEPWPIYINLVRDPIERLVSWFYYARAPWYLAERRETFGDAVQMPSIEWLRKDFNRCIEEQDPECVYEQMEMGNLGDHRRQSLFFCGQIMEVCMPFNSHEAMQRAKRNVEEHYAVVGTWEDTNTTLSVLEGYIPRFFAGAKEEYYILRKKLGDVNRNSFRPTLSDKARALLSRNLTREIEFYQFTRHRLYKLYIALQLDANPKLRQIGYNVHARRSSEEEHADPDRHGHHHDHHSHHHHVHHQGKIGDHDHKAAHDKQLAVPENKHKADAALYEDDEDDEEADDDDLADGVATQDDGGFNFEADLLNNTKFAESDFVFFNRVPKVGSQSLMELMARLGKINGFNHARNKGGAHETVLMNKQRQTELVAELLTRPKPHIYSQHIAYINFTRFHLPKPIYINLVRDPIDRIISWHYYIRAPWYYRDMQAKLGDKAPAMPSEEFLNLDLDTCVRNHDPHCTFTQDQIKNAVGDHRRQTLFFCGMNQKLCMPFNSEAAMQKAKRTVESEYAVVGTWEDTNITLTVLEAYIPRFFRNAKVAYYLGKDRLSRVNRNNVTRVVSDETRVILRKNLTNEIEFYEFCKQRLYLQYAALSHGKRFGEDDYLLVPEQQNDYNEEY